MVGRGGRGGQGRGEVGYDGVDANFQTDENKV